MGFILMILSAIIGIFLVIVGFARAKQNTLYKVLLIIGILLILFSIYLALPK
ncbi:hypothetical protein MPS01_09690 [Marinilactibacillus psychrotolerans]|uniref:Exosortase n=2 Tax=Marinilactibacillus psychrotolerans TaxID=191770 RepID=A0AAV3WVS2_9LACT|nr:DUF3953 domain-containing protein [Marinilactibacillus psychrotolerans]GEL66814.1 hypothetical protein MPS01_09690 [Marinilactibacillus psychrotolerans]GEQ35739.1 hypothetical protein M132T_12470 [Marinilactibacillus psychrotolerans]SDC35561.1 hypothetical protein SAMN04488013_104114 [Marinilactibacillus psychrotolerans]SJN17366.1 hypothetical protein FM115_00415 [Marinilactibacillus psychrotolerans 42ea]